VKLASLKIGEYFIFLQVLVFICCRPKTEDLICGLKRPVFCKKYEKRNALQVYANAYEENRVQVILE
jgi:hypothetical protein